MLTFNILFDEVDRGPGLEKKYFYISFKCYKYIAFLKKLLPIT